MVKAILADVNIEGHAEVILDVLESESWHELWAEVNLPFLTFEDLHWDREMSDALLWQTCQEQQFILLTANRNAEDPDSLELTMRARNTADSLPIFTLADADRVLDSRDYAQRVAARLLDYLQTIDRVHGTGRLYLP